MRYSGYSTGSWQDTSGGSADDSGGVQHSYGGWGWNRPCSSGWQDWYQPWRSDWKSDWNGWGWWCPDRNTPPDAVDDVLTVLNPGEAVTGSLLDNDTDDDGDRLTVTSINGIWTQVGVPLVFPEGRIEVQADGSFTVEAESDFSFTYTIWDGQDFDTATVEVNVVDPIFFRANGEIWKTDGTPEGTERVLDNAAAGLVSVTEYLTSFNGGFLFAGRSADDLEPWFSDGTPAGTYQIADIREDGSSSPNNFTVFEDIAFFAATGEVVNSDSNTELYRTDGTPEGTFLLADIREGLKGSDPGSFLVAGSQVFFRARTDDEGFELWRTDGTPDGTFLVRDLKPGPDSSSPQMQFEFDGKAVVRAGSELWISDGTEVGTTLLADDVAGAVDLGHNDDIYFFRRDDEGTHDLWRSGGTVDDMELIADINVGSSSSGFAELGDSFMFAANFRKSGGYELWKTDGTSDGTVLVRNINSTGDDLPAGDPANYSAEFSPIDGGLIFVADDGVNGREPWFTDGTFDGTYLIKDINPSGNSMGRGHDFTYLDGKAVFRASTPDEGPEPWISDGTADGTFLLADIVPGRFGSFPDDFIA